MTASSRRSAIVLGAAAVFISAASFRPHPLTVTSVPEAPTEVERIYAPFDTLETDLNDYRWPMDERYLTTSVFGDYRSTHFHGGIDISTQGREGLPVRAMRDGWVSLVRHSPHGYGNVVELTHADGFTTWYAHLSGFAPRLDSLIRPLLRQSGGVAAEAKPDTGLITVQAGDVIAFSGSTGAGGPHHHFEIRDTRGNPVDPMLVPSFGERVADRIAPTFEELGIVPLIAGTTVQGQLRPVYIRPARRSGSSKIDQRLRITGDVGLTVRVLDAVGPRRFTNRNVALELLVDGVSVYASRVARVPSDDSKQIALHYDWSAKSSGHPFHQKLFLEEGNRLPFYDRAPYGTGILRSTDFQEGTHRLEVVARDLNGNESRLQADIVFNHPPVILAERLGSSIVVSPASDIAIDRLLIGTSHDGVRVTPWKSLDVAMVTYDNGRWSIPVTSQAPYLSVTALNRFGTASDPVWLATAPVPTSALRLSTEVVRDMAIVTVRSERPLSAAPRIRVLAEADVPEPAVRSLSARHYATSFALRPELGRSISIEAVVDGPDGTVTRAIDELVVNPITPSTGGMAELPDQSFHLHFGPNGVLSDTYVQLEQTALGVNAEPSDRVLDEGATVEMDVPTELLSRKAGLFLFTGGDEQLLAWRPAFGDRRLRGRVNRFLGTFRVLEDASAPRFDRAYLSYRSGTLILELRIRDDRSGLATSSLHVSIDGEPLPATFDSDRRRLYVHERLTLAKGRHRVVVRASDRMENEREWVGTVSVR